MDSTGPSADSTTQQRLRSAVTASGALAQLQPQERAEVLLAVDASWDTLPGTAMPRMPALLARALGAEWPSRIHAGLTEDPAAPIAPHQLPHLLRAVDGALTSGRGERFTDDVVDLVGSGWPS